MEHKGDWMALNGSLGIPNADNRALEVMGLGNDQSGPSQMERATSTKEALTCAQRTSALFRSGLWKGRR
jgi:hypothetical protein